MKNFQKRSGRNVAIILVVVVMSIVGWKTCVCSQALVPDWPTVFKALQFRRDSVKSLEVVYRHELYFTSSQDKERLDSLKKVYEGYPIPTRELITNRVYTSYLAKKDNKWRFETTEVFPGADDGRPYRNYAAFNGQKYFAYEDSRQLGRVGASFQDLHMDSDLTQTDVLELGLINPLNQVEGTPPSFQDAFKFQGKETINGEECLKYVSHGKPNILNCNFSIWVSPSKGFAVAHYQLDLFGGDTKYPNSGSIQIYDVEKFVEADKGFFVAAKAKREYYEVHEGKPDWVSTTGFSLDSIKINPELSESLFEEHFAPGTKVSDSAHKGAIKVIGGDYSGAVGAAKNKQAPQRAITENGKIDFNRAN